MSTLSQTQQCFRAGQWQVDELANTSEYFEREYRQLQIQIASLERDKARLDWLQNNFHYCRTTDVALSDGYKAWEFYIPSGDGRTDLRAAIDKVIKDNE